MKNSIVNSHNLDQSNIINLYLEGCSLRQISNLYNCSVQAIYNILKKNNISRRTNRKYYLDEHFLDQIDTVEKAYIIGLFYADGYNNNKELCIKLIDKDQDLLNLIKKFFKSERPLRFITSKNKNHNNTVVLELSSVLLCKQASKIGITKNKTFKICFPNFLNLSLIPHFIRGYFDGDGCIYYNTKTNNIKFTLLGTLDMCEKIQDYFQRTINVNSSIITNKRINSNIKILSVGGNVQVKKVMDLIYQNNTIYMQRKYDKYQKFKQLLILNDKSKNSIHTQFKFDHSFQNH